MKDEIIENIVKKETYNNSDISTRRFLDRLGGIAEAACDEYNKQKATILWKENDYPKLSEEYVYECVLKSLLQIFAVKIKNVESYYIDKGSIPF